VPEELALVERMDVWDNQLPSSSPEAKPTTRLRIAWFGPVPTDEGGVAGVARGILSGLTRLGHQVDCYLTGEPHPLPEELAGLPSLTAHWSGSGWQWQRWYSRDPLSAFITGTSSRALGMRRLGRMLVRHHRDHPYDVVYQFSNIEIFGFRRCLEDLPPLVLHPETHAAGELRWLLKESHLAARCAPVYRRSLVKGALAFRSLVQRRYIHRASAVICISRCFRSHLVADYGLCEARTVVVPNPIQLERFAPDSEAPLRHPLTVLFVGRVSVRKGIDAVVELSHRLDDLQGSVKINVIGGHSLWSDYRKLLDDLNPSIATYLGPMGPEEVTVRLLGADLLIQPSTYEPFGLTVGEALAAGLPVVATDQVGAAEDVDGACCLVVPAGNVVALEKAVRTMVARLSSPERLAMRTLARSEAERLFDPSEVSERVSEVLIDAAAGWVGRAGRRCSDGWQRKTDSENVKGAFVK
jgi:glycosyltransferase involved in cell wall biosynthesis